MLPYTTPTHRFRIPIPTTDLKAIKICYAQNDEIKLTKTLDDCELTSTNVVVTLTQEETGVFEMIVPVTIQLHILTKSDVAMQSQQIRMPCGKVLDCEVI